MSNLSSTQGGRLELDQVFDVNLESEFLAALLLSGAPFPVNGDELELGEVSFIPGAGPVAMLGDERSPLRLIVSGELSMKKRLVVIWEESAMVAGLAEELGRAIDFSHEAVLLLEIESSGAMEASGQSPIAAYVTGSVSGAADGRGSYRFAMIFEKEAVARTVLRELFNRLRWPLKSRLPKEELLEGDVAVVDLRGQISLQGEVTAGYQVRGSQSVDVKGLNPEFLYEIRLGARLKAGVTLGGGVRVVSRSGHKAGWVRLQVCRADARSRSLEAGLDFLGNIEVSPVKNEEGEPLVPESLLGTLTGLNLNGALSWVEAASEAENWDDVIDRIESKYGVALADAASGFFEGLVEGVSIDRLREKAGAVLVDLQEFVDDADRRVLEVAEQSLGKVEAVVADIEEILGKATRIDLTEISDSSSWLLIEQILGVDARGVLESQPLFHQMQAKLKKLRELLAEGGRFEALKSFMENVKEQLNVDGLVETLGALDSKEALDNIVSKKSGMLVGKLFELSRKELSKTGGYKKVKAGAKRLLAMRSEISEALANGFARKIELSLAVQFSRSQSRSVLLDIELDRNTPTGRELYEKAIRGDFAEISKHAGDKSVLVREGAFQRGLTESSSLKLHAFGWGRESFSRASQLASAKIVSEGNGMVFLYDSQTRFESRFRKGFGLSEAISTAYNLRAQAEALVTNRNSSEQSGNVDTRRFFGDGVVDLASSYEVIQSDAKPDWQKLPRYLKFAAQLGIAKSAEAMATALYEEFGDGEPTRFSINYTIRYSPDAFEGIFVKYDEELGDLASEAFRGYFSDRYYSAAKPFFSEESLASYLTHSHIEERRWSTRHENGRKRYYVYDAQGNCDIVQNGHDLFAAYQAESRFKKALLQLDMVLDSIREDGQLEEHQLDLLNGALMELVSLPKKGGQVIWKENLFFLVLDVLQRSVDPEARKGRTFMELTIDFADRESVRRLYAV